MTGSRARRRRACSVFLLTAFFATTSLEPCSWEDGKRRDLITSTLFRHKPHTLPLKRASGGGGGCGRAGGEGRGAKNGHSHLFECGKRGLAAAKAKAAVAPEAVAANFGDSGLSQHAAVEAELTDSWLNAGVRRFYRARGAHQHLAGLLTQCFCLDQ